MLYNSSVDPPLSARGKQTAWWELITCLRNQTAKSTTNQKGEKEITDTKAKQNPSAQI